MEKNEMISRIEGSGHGRIKFAVSDIDGILRAKTLNLKKFREIADKSIGFCDVIFGWDVNDKCYDNTKITGWHTGYPDQQVRIDLNTFRRVPWDNDLPYFLGDFSVEGSEVAACPRSLLKKIRRECEELGYQAVFSQEFEWFNFTGTPNQLADTDYRELTPMSSGMFGYSQLRPALHRDYFNELFDSLEKFNVPLEALHTETGPGVYEASIRHDEILSAADKAILFKTAVREIAYRHGLMASFMAKWNADLPGCSGHIHQSLWSSDGKRNLFFPGPGQQKMNRLMESYLAGQLFCLPEILPMYAPTINSYKRLRNGSWAPSTVTWGTENRTTAIRLIEGDESATRLEMRVPGSDCNPYLAMSAALASGIYGIRNNLRLEIPETKGNAYAKKEILRLPADLKEATGRMHRSAVAKELFGEAFTDHFTRTREWECDEFARAVTSWELKRYFEII